MSCRVQNFKTGEIEYTLPNNKESKLFKSLKSATQNSLEAEKLYEQIRSKEFKNWFGRDWEKDYSVDFFTDENGEPELVDEIGFHSFKNNKGETFPIYIQIKESSNSLNIGRDIQKYLEILNKLKSILV